MITHTRRQIHTHTHPGAKPGNPVVLVGVGCFSPYSYLLHTGSDYSLFTLFRASNYSERIYRIKWKTSHKTRRCRCGGRSLSWSKNVLVALCSKCFKLKYFWIWLFTHKESCEIQKQAWSTVVPQMSYLKEPDWVKKKRQEKTVTDNWIAQE